MSRSTALSRGRRALQLHSVDGWQELVAELEADVRRTAADDGVGSGPHRQAAAELRRAESWRDSAVSEYERQHRYDNVPEAEVARRVADKIWDR